MAIIETDRVGHTTIPGHPSEIFFAEDTLRGGVLLHGIPIDRDLQRDYDTSPEFRALLSRAMASPSVAR